MVRLCFVLFFCGVSTVFGQFGDPVPRSAAEIDGLFNMKSQRPYFSETDLSIAGRGLPLEFRRYYNGGGILRYPTGASYLGHRWSHTYQWQLYRQQTASYENGRHYTVINYNVISGSGAKMQFYKYRDWHGALLSRTWQPRAGVRATLTESGSGADKTFIYTTKHGVQYKFEDLLTGDDTFHVLTEIKDRNGNRLTLHYQQVSGWNYSEAKGPRLQAVTDTVGRVLKFHYDLTIPGVFTPRHITKIEFGKGSASSLSEVYQTVMYDYPVSSKSRDHYNAGFTKVRFLLGISDPRGASLDTTYEYGYTKKWYGLWSYALYSIVSPRGNRTDFTPTTMSQRDVPKTAGTLGDLLRHRKYSYGNAFAEGDWRRDRVAYDVSNNKRGNIRAYNFTTAKSEFSFLRLGYTGRYSTLARYVWHYDTQRNVTTARQRLGDSTERWDYLIRYQTKQDKQMSTPTLWRQLMPAGRYRRDLARAKVQRNWTADYDPNFNRPLWQVDPMGHKTEFTYDSKGNLTKVKSVKNTGTQPHAIAHDIETTHKYDSYGNRIKTTNQLTPTKTQVIETVFDSTYHTYPVEVKTTITKGGKSHTIKTKMEWDVHRGLKTADIDALGNRTEYTYWKDRWLKYTKDVAANLYTVPTYDKSGNVTQVQVRQNHFKTGTLIAQKKTEYDGLNRVTKVHSFKDNWTTPYATTETTYGAFGDIATTKDPRGLITTYTHDDWGRVTKQTLPDGDWIETRYNPLSKVTKSWTSNNGTESSPAVSYTYDTLNRPLKVSYKSGELVAYTYDKGDNLLTLTTNDGSTTYTYTYTHDQLNRVITRNDSLLGYKTFYEYDDVGRRTRQHIKLSTGGNDLYDVTYTYDKANRLTSVRAVLAGKTASYDYFDIGALKTSILPNGITAHRALDTRHRLDRLIYKKNSTALLSSLDYTYDVKSNVTQLVRNDTGAGGTSKTFTFGYDGISRLTSANYGDETVSYTYDKAGNRLTQVSTVNGTTRYTIDTKSNQLTYRSLVPESTDFSTMSYTYDAEGKLTQRSEGGKSDAFTYGWGSKLKQVRKSRSGSPNQTISYGYDGAGKRVKVTDSNGTRYFLYDGGMPVLELNGQKAIKVSYLYGADGVVYHRIHGVTKSQDKYEYHHVNGLGSPIVLTDNSKAVVARYEYDVFGTIRNETGSSDNVRKFTGKEWDADVRLHYFAARYYDPYIGRFTQRDPAGDGVNWYIYGRNNPLKYIDPTGMWVETFIDVAGAGLSIRDFIRAPGLATAAWAAVDTAAVFVPFIPGTKTGRLAVKMLSADGVDVFKGVKAFNAGNARRNLQKLSGLSDEVIKGLDAHHLIPQQKEIRSRLKEMGSEINPDNPALMTWWKNSKAGGTHQNFKNEINDQWLEFLSKDRTDDEILEFTHKIAKDYQDHYFQKEIYFELYQHTNPSY